MRYEVRAPLAGFTGNVVGIDFQGGTGEFDDNNDAGRSARAYFERAGYRMDPLEAAQPDPEPPPPPADVFDPSAHTVEDVLAHLDAADADEAARVLDAEEAGKNRATFLKQRDAILAAKTTPAPPEGDNDQKGAEQ
jgi:hypothetical protein